MNAEKLEASKMLNSKVINSGDNSYLILKLDQLDVDTEKLKELKDRIEKESISGRTDLDLLAKDTSPNRDLKFQIALLLYENYVKKLSMDETKECALLTTQLKLYEARTLFGYSEAESLELIKSIGKMHHELREYKEAVEYKQRAYKIRVDISSKDHTELINLLNSLGFSKLRMQNYSDALATCFQPALDMCDRLFKPDEDRLERAKALLGASKSNALLKNVEKAEELALAAHEMYNRIHENKDHMDVAKSLGVLSIVSKYKEDYSKALEYQNSCFEMIQRLHLSGQVTPEQLGISLSLSGFIYDLMKDKKTSREYLKRALGYFEDYLKVKNSYRVSIYTASTLEILVYLFDSFDENECINYGLRLIELRKSQPKKDLESLSLAYKALTLSYMRAGQKDKAKESLDQGYELHKIADYSDQDQKINTELHFLTMLGQYYTELDNKTALEYLNRAINLAEEHYPKIDNKVKFSINNSLFAVYVFEKQLKKALECQVEAFRLAKIVAPDEVIDVAMRLAKIYKELGMNKETLDCQLAICKELEERNAADSPKKAVIFYDTAVAYFELEKLDSALEYFQKVLDMFKRSNDKRLLTIQAECLNQMGAIFIIKKEPQKALPYQLESLNLKRTFEYSSESDKVASLGISLINVGDTYESLKDIQNADKYYTELLDLKGGSGNPALAEWFKKGGQFYYINNQYKKSIAFLTKALEIQRSILKQKETVQTRTETERILHNLWQANSICLQHSQGLPYLEEAYSIAHTLYKPDQVEMIEYLNNFGVHYLRSKDFSRALEYFHKAYQECDTILSREIDPKIEKEFRMLSTIILGNISTIHMDRQQFSEAVNYLEKSIELCNGDGRYDLAEKRIKLLFTLADCYTSMSRHDGALETKLQVLQELKAHETTNNLDLCRVLSSIADSHYNLGKEENIPEYLKYKQQAFDMLKQIDKDLCDPDKYELTKMKLIDSAATGSAEIGDSEKCIEYNLIALEFFKQKLQNEPESFPLIREDLKKYLLNLITSYSKIGDKEKIKHYEDELDKLRNTWTSSRACVIS